MASLKDFRFADIPPVGIAIAIRGQRYDAVKVEPHTRRDGGEAHLVTWASHCAQCGCAIAVRCTSKSLPETRRCAEHRQPGKRIEA